MDVRRHGIFCRPSSVFFLRVRPPQRRTVRCDRHLNEKGTRREVPWQARLKQSQRKAGSQRQRRVNTKCTSTANLSKLTAAASSPFTIRPPKKSSPKFPKPMKKTWIAASLPPKQPSIPARGRKPPH